MYRYCYNPDCSFRAWPDGKNYFEQSEITVKIFLIINDETAKIIKEKSNG